MNDFSFHADQIRSAVWEAVAAISAPHAVMRPHVFPDGGLWCALYGKDLQEGVAGFGETPHAACLDFDKNWSTQTLRRSPSLASQDHPQEKNGG